MNENLEPKISNFIVANLGNRSVIAPALLYLHPSMGSSLRCSSSCIHAGKGREHDSRDGGDRATQEAVAEGCGSFTCDLRLAPKEHKKFEYFESQSFSPRLNQRLPSSELHSLPLCPALQVAPVYLYPSIAPHNAGQ